LLRDEKFSRGTTLITIKSSLTESDNSCPITGASVCSYAPAAYEVLQPVFQSISSGVYLHIRRHLLAPPAVSLSTGFGLLYECTHKPDIPSEDIFLSVIAFSAVIIIHAKQNVKLFFCINFEIYPELSLGELRGAAGGF